MPRSTDPQVGLDRLRRVGGRRLLRARRADVAPDRAAAPCWGSTSAVRGRGPRTEPSPRAVASASGTPFGQTHRRPGGRAAAPPPFRREQIVAFIAEATERSASARSRRPSASRAPTKIGLKRILKEIEEDGAIDRGRGGLAPAGRLPPVVLADIRSRDRDGDFLAVPAEWDAGTGKPPIHRARRAARRAARATARPPGIGDRALRAGRAGDADGRLHRPRHQGDRQEQGRDHRRLPRPARRAAASCRWRSARRAARS